MSKQIFTNAFVDVIGAQKGVFSKRSFSRGDLVLETTGEFAKKQSIYTIQVAKDKHFTPDPPVKFLNHSCDPNLGVKTKSNGIPDFFAIKEIKENEQLTFDYAMTEFTLAERLESGEEAWIKCECGTQKCRGLLGSFADLPEETKQEYEGFIAEYLLE
eukprot:TRINITY_DN4817_c0_g1_i2.p1 TRINITY_DN4817_c0_g1~~TRINITY_DN4817_c0_g1_i2.p1  ORF type:complete len:158 (+),score=36.53 TRINITY_DN4817_c0_g1_i2:299-772(+)